MKRFTDRFTVRDMIIISAMAALGIAVKPVVVPIAHIISTPLMIPSGALAGGLYMMWLVVAYGLTGRRGTATLTGFIQAIIVIITGVVGSHGIMSLISYTLPGVAVDLGMLILRHGIDNAPCALIAGLLANVTGTACVNVIFFNLPAIPLMLSLATAAFSGSVGGLLSWALLKALTRYGITGREHRTS